MTMCLTAGTYYAVVTLVDAVDIEEVFYAEIILGVDCDIDVTDGWPGDVDCVDWETEISDTLG